MAFIDEFSDWMNETLYVYAGSQSASGGFTADDINNPVEEAAWIRREATLLKDPHGNETKSEVRAIIAAGGYDVYGYRFGLDTGPGPETLLKAKEIVVRNDEDGAADYEVVYL